MLTDSSVRASVNLAFPKAGVIFNINVEPSTGDTDGQAPTFRLSVTDAEQARAVPFTVDASPPLADWVRGYSRWLVRANVSATFDESGISGTLASGLTPEQLLRGISDACDMIRQRFGLYQESVLVS